MSEPFIGEIRVFANTFVPDGWFGCNGQTLQIQQYSALYALLGVNFGGNGTTNFMLPNLNGMAVIGAGNAPSGSTYDVGETVGEAQVVITTQTMPAHNHQLQKKVTNAPNPVSKTAAPSAVSDLGGLSNAAGTTGYKSAVNVAPAPNTVLAPNTMGPAGSGAPAGHENRQPFLGLYYGIAYEGVWPARP